MKYTIPFTQVRLTDIGLVGGKNASLGEMIQQLSHVGIKVPLGFATTVNAYYDHLEANNLLSRMQELSAPLTQDAPLSVIQEKAEALRALVYTAPLPPAIIEDIAHAYTELCHLYNRENLDVAVRSSATAEDLPQASFAGQQETYLNISGIEAVLDATKKCMASLFTERAIVYRIEHGFDHFKVGISVGIQKMVRSDKASSGVIFSLDTDTGFKDVTVITSSYGLGENIVKGVVNPDEFHVHKPTLALGFKPIIKKYCGSKETKLIYAQNGSSLENRAVPVEEQRRFSLSDNDILTLARQAGLIENHYSTLNNAWRPMDIEWAKDGIENELYIIQARPETIFGWKSWTDQLIRYELIEDRSTLTVLTTGLSIGQKIAHGSVRIIQDMHDDVEFNAGDVLVTTMTDPDWVPLMKKAAAVITDNGGRTCHAAIVSRELGIPAVIGTSNATTQLTEGISVTVDCSEGSVGRVYEGIHEFNVIKTELATIPKPAVPILVNIAEPERAYQLSFLPVSGVGLARVEFIITTSIKVHPMAVCKPDKINETVTQAIEKLSFAYGDAKTFFVDTLAQGIAMIAAAFYPREVIVRLSDFKTNEYRNLIGGEFFEPVEENPMLGFRGAARYCDPFYAPAFELECRALKKARDEMGLTNIKILVPFVRNLEEAQCTLAALQSHGLKRGLNGLQILMMCEIPSNVILLEEFSRFFDGFSIGSNDLTQMTLAVDRDSAQLTQLFDERDPAVKKMLQLALESAKKAKAYMSICGQAPSDFPEIAEFLIQNGIDAISLNADSVIPFLLRDSAAPVDN